MSEHAETFHANKGCKMAIFFFVPVSSFSKKEIKGAIFKRYLHENVSFHTPAFYIPYFITLSWLKAVDVIFSHIKKYVSLHRRI